MNTIRREEHCCLEELKLLRELREQLNRLREQIQHKYAALAPKEILEGFEGDECEVVCGTEEHAEIANFRYVRGTWQLVSYREEWVTSEP